MLNPYLNFRMSSILAFMQILLVTAGSIDALAGSADTATKPQLAIDLSGSHYGFKTKDDETKKKAIHLIIRPLEGRSGGYLGLLVESYRESTGFLGLGHGRRVFKAPVLYRIDPKTSDLTNYDVTPFSYSDERGFYIPSVDPTLGLSWQKSKGKTGVIHLSVNAGSSNSMGFMEAADFEMNESPLEWKDCSRGSYFVYKNGEDKESVLISPKSIDDSICSVEFTQPVEGFPVSTFAVFEYSPLSFVLKKTTALGEGDDLEQKSSGAIFFLDDGSDRKALLVYRDTDGKLEFTVATRR